MEYVIASFRSRAHTVRFYEFLRGNGITAEIINTPKEAGVGCGLSVKVSPSNLFNIKRGVRMAKLSSFAGIFLIKITGDKRIVRTI